MSGEAVVVGVRLRPFVGYEQGQSACLEIRDDKTVSVLPQGGREARDFAFDVAMDSTDKTKDNYASQVKCYELMAKKMIEHIIAGYSTCLFCYGQTGTGKTTTIMGSPKPVSEQGLLLRLINDLFEFAESQREQGSSINLKVQMLEVYNEKIKDLLAPKTDSFTRQKPPEVHVHPKHGVYVKGATDPEAKSFDHCIELIEWGNSNKTVAATAMNKNSSRGHTVFKLVMEKRGGSDNTTVMSEAFFVDLAGRENEKTTKVTGERFLELTFINRSLMWLATCIQSLAPDRSRSRKTVAYPRSPVAEPMESDGSDSKRMSKGEIPAAPPPEKKETKTEPSWSKFRNSKLTLLLSNALSGNSKTSMIGTLSPAVANFDESFSTLQFASTVKSIKVEAKPATEVDKESLVKSLREELKTLKDQLTEAREEGNAEEIRDKLECTQSLFEQYKKKWEDAHNDTKELMAKREEAMAKLGAARWHLAVTRAKKRTSSESQPVPYLANYSDEAHVCGRLVIYLPEDEDRPFHVGYGAESDFQIPRGVGISSRTAMLRRSGESLFIRPAEPAADNDIAQIERPKLVEVNGVELEGDQEIELKHKDLVVLGRSLMLYAFILQDGGMATISAEKKRESKLDPHLHDSFLAVALGENRGMEDDQLLAARQLYTQLRARNLNARGSADLNEFMEEARNAMCKVAEANAITKSVLPGCNQRFELRAVAPVLAFGFGSNSLPALMVQLVEIERRASRRATVLVREGQVVGKIRQTWMLNTFDNHMQRLRDVHERWSADPDDFTLDANCDPWAPQGWAPGAPPALEVKEELEAAKNKENEELNNLVVPKSSEERERMESELWDSNAVDRRSSTTSLVQRGSVLSVRNSLSVNLKLSTPAELMLLEPNQLYDRVRSLEYENAKLKAKVTAMETEFRNIIKLLNA